MAERRRRGRHLPGRRRRDRRGGPAETRPHPREPLPERRGTRFHEPWFASSPGRRDAAEDGDSRDSPDTAGEAGEATAGTDRVGDADASHASGPAGDEDPTPSEGLTVTLGSSPEGFYVADDGVGVPPEDRERVFESGYSTDEEGIGTGLAVVEDLATAHGWTVSVTESAAGGARFEFGGVEVPDERAG
ncbi:hypothetical protein BRC75_05550 [Halobacteriales archaeon QH_7_69_31]|nr:MAG: hypothetical protein BRC75_05550 [Halobacteriales archaeon QH_7_69_31]